MVFAELLTTLLFVQRDQTLPCKRIAPLEQSSGSVGFLGVFMLILLFES